MVAAAQPPQSSVSTDSPYLYSPPSSDTTVVKNLILAQLNSPKVANFESSGLTEKYNELWAMFEHTVRDRQGSSVLVIGPRAVGKTAIINQALDKLAIEYDGRYIVVRLSAYFHPDEHGAVREIARQLDINAKKNHSSHQSQFQQPAINDTFSNILNILDHPNSSESMAVIFIVDEIDKFTDNKQTLLYNLLDLAQTSQVPICVVGVSPKITVRELFEKRVRSRFSQRVISLTKPGSVDHFWAGAKLALLLSPTHIAQLQDANYGRLWNQYIDSLFTRSPPVRKLVYELYYCTKNYRQFNIYSAYAVAQISPQCPFPIETHFLHYASVQPPGTIQGLFQSLSSLELLLAIAAARWIEKFDLPTINFNLAYKEYEEMIKSFNISSTTLATSSPSRSDTRILTNIKVNQKVWSAKVLRNSWESLYRMGLLIDQSGVSTNADGHVISNAQLNKTYTIEDSKMVQLDTNLEEIGSRLDDQDPFKRLTKL
ncbi:Origin recognition complex subunit 4 [Meyerozyma sp. JA9]|nr:Origin recognition complex subunit 4 [Meyerozyma sp. JA9]